MILERIAQKNCTIRHMKSYFQCCWVILTPNTNNRKDRRTPPHTHTHPFKQASKHQAPRLIQWDTLVLPSTTPAVSLDAWGFQQCWPHGCFPQLQQQAGRTGSAHRDLFQQHFNQALSHREHQNEEKNPKIRGSVQMRIMVSQRGRKFV